MKKTLVVGASEKPYRYAYKATKMLKDYGHEVLAFGKKKGYIDDTSITDEWPDDKEVETVTLYINPELQRQYYEKIIALKPKRVIFNPGTENIEFEKYLAQNNIQPIEACTLVMLATNQY
ncbi:MAG: CoA-binding protein [Bacteroidia bacterium]